MNGKKHEKSARLLTRLAGAILFCLLCGGAFAFFMAVPDNVKKLPPEQQRQWMEDQAKTAHDRQMQVYHERIEQHEHLKQSLGQAMALQSAKRREVIKLTQIAVAKREKAASTYDGTITLLTVLALLGILAGFLFQRLRPTSRKL